MAKRLDDIIDVDQSSADEAVKIEWSSDENPAAAYETFKNRKSLKRKRAVAEGKRVRGTAGPTTKRSSNSTVVGRRVPRQALNADEAANGKKKTKDYGDESSDLEEQLLDEVLPDYIKNRKATFEKVRAKLGDAGLSLPPDFEDIPFSDDDRPGLLEEKPSFSDIEPCAPHKDIVLQYSAGIIPAPIAKWLRDYQVKGAQFLHEKFVYQQGGILGDDMGLGKTIQVIAFLTAAFGKTGDIRDNKRMRKMRRVGGDRWYPRVLIICPGALMPNWQAELRRWGWWQIYIYHGSTNDKEAALQAAAKGMAEIMITTYTTYKRNMSAINTVKWDCVIADECHAFKEQKSDITKAMNDVNALCRLGLTGTAIQNNYDELWSLLNWANPGVLGSLAAWRFSISNPLKTGQAHDASVSELATARRTAQSLVQNLLPRFFLRRMKSLIADQLPKKSDRVVFCPLSAKQAEAYENFLNGEIVEYIRDSTTMCGCGSGKRQGWCCYAEIPERGAWQKYVFPCIVVLQKLSNHLALLLPGTGDSVEKREKDLDNLQEALPHDWKELNRQKDSIMNYANEEFCGKWQVLSRLLRYWFANKDKVLIFSHSVRLLKMLQVLFMSTTAYNISYLDGSLSYEKRQEEVDKFNSDPTAFVFLISTRAGGVGLNITSANKVVVVDPNWNPSYDLQAQDRAYRIGQKRDVEVFRLVSAGTIEEIVYARQIYKQQQANIGYNASLERRYFKGVQDMTEKKGEIFGLRNLFAYQKDNVVLKDIVNKTNIAESKAGVMVAEMDLTQTTTLDLGEHDDDPIQTEKDSQDAAMSQLAKLIENGGDALKPKKHATAVKKTDIIQGILASVGVEYTHENSEVVGTSKIESKLSRQAMDRVNHDLNVDAPVFIDTQADDSDRGYSTGSALSEGDYHPGEVSTPKSGFKYRYRPPEDVRKRQFCTMAKIFGFADVTEFALVVEGWTQEQRRNCLEKFYAARRKTLRNEGQADHIEIEEIEEPKTKLGEDIQGIVGTDKPRAMIDMADGEETTDDEL